MKTRLSIAALLVVSAASALADPPLYRISIIDPAAGDGTSFAYGINEAGNVVGGTYAGTTPFILSSRAFYWSGGSMTVIGGGVAGSQAFDINESGIACMQSLSAGVNGAYRYDSNTNTLTALQGTGALARGITGTGMVVGTFGPKDKKLPVSWAGGSTTMSLINTESGNPQGFLQGANELGQVLGRDDYFKNPNGAFSVTRDSWVWQNGTYIDLTRPSGDNSEAMALNRVGKAAGIVTDDQGDYRAALWDFSSGTASCTLITDVAGKFIPSAINDSGTIIGNKFNQRYATNFGADETFLYTGGTSYALQSLLDSSDATSAGFTIRAAMDINNKGQIVGYGVDAAGRNVAYVANLVAPVPEPATLLTLGGLSALALRKRRRK